MNCFSFVESKYVEGLSKTDGIARMYWRFDNKREIPFDSNALAYGALAVT